MNLKQTDIIEESKVDKLRKLISDLQLEVPLLNEFIAETIPEFIKNYTGNEEHLNSFKLSVNLVFDKKIKELEEIKNSKLETVIKYADEVSKNSDILYHKTKDIKDEIKTENKTKNTKQQLHANFSLNRNLKYLIIFVVSCFLFLFLFWAAQQINAKISDEAAQAELDGVASKLSIISSLNYATRKYNNAKGMAVTNCTDIEKLMLMYDGKKLPAGYTITTEDVVNYDSFNGISFYCMITGKKDKTVTVEIMDIKQLN